MSDPQADPQELLLAWDRDDSLAGGLSVLGQLLTETEGAIGRMLALEEHGLDGELLTSNLHYDSNEGALLTTGLQVLGVLDPNLREMITALLYRLHDAAPVLDDELQEKVRAAASAAVEEFMGQADEIGRNLFAGPNGNAN